MDKDSTYKNFNHKLISSILHNRLRLAILCAVAHSDEVDFMSLRNAVKTTDGNLSIQLKILEEQELIVVNKLTVSRRNQTNIAVTNKGLSALKVYREHLLSWLNL